ncbi:MAG: GIY-YIG nuclease family protein [Hyphomonadaceae bacterium]|nr:GIY-YIG nuclease family protein [Hyphomonadaceae bacterium]
MARFDFIATYIMANRKNGAIYTGSASDLPARVGQHKQGIGSKFTKKYGCTRLVWFEQFEAMEFAVRREKQIKRWPRQWKINLIEEFNPVWLDLSAELL